MASRNPLQELLRTSMDAPEARREYDELVQLAEPDEEKLVRPLFAKPPNPAPRRTDRIK